MGHVPWVLIPQHTENSSSFLNILKIPWTIVIRHTNPFFKEIYHSSLCFLYQIRHIASHGHIIVCLLPAARSAALRASSVLAVASASTVKPVSLQVSVGQALLAFFPRSIGKAHRYRTEVSTSLSPALLRPLLPHVKQASHSPNATMAPCEDLPAKTSHPQLSTSTPPDHFDFLPSQIYFNIKLVSLIQC